jgi:hypothetical protein
MKRSNVVYKAPVWRSNDVPAPPTRTPLLFERSENAMPLARHGTALPST